MEWKRFYRICIYYLALIDSVEKFLFLWMKWKNQIQIWIRGNGSILFLFFFFFVVDMWCSITKYWSFFLIKHKACSSLFLMFMMEIIIFTMKEIRLNFMYLLFGVNWQRCEICISLNEVKESNPSLNKRRIIFLSFISKLNFKRSIC